MNDSEYKLRRQFERLDRDALTRHQLAALNKLLDNILPSNQFYAAKLQDVTRPLTSLEQLRELPFTTKADLQTDGDFAANRTFPLERYSRFHRTSGTHGRPMIVVDTADDWQHWIDIWQFVLDAAEIETSDRVFMAFSFGPFVGFWSANDALVARGCMVVPAGGLSTLARIELLRVSQSTVVCCTPSYALRMAEVAAEHQIDLRESSVTRIIVAGEPGGSVPSIRQRIENAWAARVVDHSGATEIGPWGFADAADSGLHVAERDFLPEFISIETGQPAQDGELSELILTTLGRVGCPVIRYRTGDLVRPNRAGKGDNRFVFLADGVLGRTDDMLVIRGVNIFPSAVEQIICEFQDVQEYRITALRHGEMDAIVVEVEDALSDPQRIAKALNVRLGLNVEVACVPLGSLPRFEGKGKRFVDKRKQP